MYKEVDFNLYNAECHIPNKDVLLSAKEITDVINKYILEDKQNIKNKLIGFTVIGLADPTTNQTMLDSEQLIAIIFKTDKPNQFKLKYYQNQDTTNNLLVLVEFGYKEFTKEF